MGEATKFLEWAILELYIKFASSLLLSKMYQKSPIWN